MVNPQKYFTIEEIKQANKIKREKYIDKLGGLDVFKSMQRARAKKNYAENHNNVKTIQQNNYFIKNLFN